MKLKIIYILCFLLCFSCANNTKADQMMTKDEAVESEEFKVDKSDLRDDLDEKNKNAIEIDFSLNAINSEIEEKLQANYEAKVLAVKHPEFQEVIKEQLANSTKFNFSLPDSIQTIEIKDIVFAGNLKKENDSIYKQKVLYTSLINSKHTQKDSALVVMKRTMIVIDNSLKMNTSFLFEKLD
ncbi:hypothetical protein H2O64_13550 [Kordia sp. YSTF-M3]|uniref:Lipoprotein n=1 Tax=Kordia aestuariivivens TaxID=2759037 RepID=A0ABR7QAU6_9FLAO|nr:hypothetical protein [Kordia aestuariivivens]MBC8755695.1 hypothetical protein [Kordia aestuariivivens]